MKLPLPLLLFLPVFLFAVMPLFAQRKVELVFKAPKKWHTEKIADNLYDQIDVLDDVYDVYRLCERGVCTCAGDTAAVG